MINLLDSSSQKELRAARLNVTLITYSVIVVFAVVCVGLLALFSYWYLNNRTDVAKKETTKNQSQTTGYETSQAEASEFSANLSKIQSIFQNRSSYNTDLTTIAAALPSGVTLTSATLTSSFLSTPLKLTATAADYAAILALKDELTKQPIFSQVSLDGANCGGSSSSDGKASTCQVAVTATLNQAVLTTGVVQ